MALPKKLHQCSEFFNYRFSIFKKVRICDTVFFSDLVNFSHLTFLRLKPKKRVLGKAIISYFKQLVHMVAHESSTLIGLPFDITDL